ncbi:uncharacterized protein isoform X3 [Danio rerio]
MSCRVKVNMRWSDFSLMWTEETSNAEAIMLPVDKIWTPGLALDNAIDATSKPYTDDVVVTTFGSVSHAVILLIAVSCDIKLFTYPFVSGQCLVAINGWKNGDCGIVLFYPRTVTTSGGTLSGEWMTENVEIAKEDDMENRKYLLVTLSINPFSAVVTLILPSALIMLADLVSFSLPIQGGERNNLKVTLMLSLTMFILILNDRLPSGGECTPLLHYHFCFCLVNLVLSMVTSLVLTHLLTSDSFMASTCLKRIRRQNAQLDQNEGAEMILQYLSFSLLLFCFFPQVLANGNSTDTFCDRRCMANVMVKKELFSGPLNDNCTILVNITSIQYETMSFNTKEMQMTSRIKVNLEWKDPDLGWMQEKARYPTIILPVDKIWTPRLVLDNAIDTTVEPYTHDVQVRRDGVVDHALILFTTVSCEINLFTYPFVSGSCPVAINGWTEKGCSLKLDISDDVTLVGGDRGEWKTTGVKKIVDPSHRVYLEVFLSINPFGAFVTLILPSVLIMLTDLGSFSVPFEGGERNTFKVTLVLSFTMFLLILNDHLPNGGNCSPVLYYHFTFCLTCLVLSILISMVLTRLSVDDSILICRRSVKVHPSDQNTKTQSNNLDQEKDTGVTTPKTGDVASEIATLQETVNILGRIDERADHVEKKLAFANRVDKFVFGFFISIYILYAITVIAITQTDICKVNNLDFWDMSSNADNSFDYSYTNA